MLAVISKSAALASKSVALGMSSLLVSVVILSTLAHPSGAQASSLYAKESTMPLHRKPDNNGTVDAQTYPWSTIGRLNIGGKSHCTGVMISKRHLFTQANCLYNKAEKRWWNKNELHYRAAYQRDNHMASSNIARVEISDSYNPKSPDSLASIAGDWALVTLKRPLGQHTGWLGLKSLNKKMRHQLRTGTAKMFNAGYHSGWEHAVRLSSGCTQRFSKQRIPKVGAIPCRGTNVAQRSLPTFVYQNGAYHLVSSAAFTKNDSPRKNDSWVFASLKTAGSKWGDSYRP
ncbi:trypsin-like serine protease [uncultured Kiloniella sp.]|uniref:trypsin-like serine peptidase n=1 Tax=uncultured Kiloniella sp. TaxID=1133091 RepID=UPI00260C2B7A|nr:trypsin-like serine protease [uncultured Kiloniella sp.]